MERAEQLARFFHETYEALAVEHGSSEQPDRWEDLPEGAREILTATCQVVIDHVEDVEEEQEVEKIVEEIHEEKRADLSEGLTVEDFHGWLLTKVGQGWPEALLLKMAVISINALMDAASRWERLEGGQSPSAPIWFDTNERDKILAAISGQKGTTIRVLRQALQKMLP